MAKFSFIKQLDANDCGPACLRMVCKYYGKTFSAQYFRNLTQINKVGVSLRAISNCAEEIGIHTLAVKITVDELSTENIFPCIVHWDQKHFIVVYKIKGNYVYVADPETGLIKYSKQEFEKKWVNSDSPNEKTGVALLLEPTPRFYEEPEEKTKGIGVNLLWGYVLQYKGLFLQILLGLCVSSLFSLALPFLTQSVVDVGIQTQNVQFIYMVLAGQSMIFLGRISVEFIRSWLLLHISTRINLSILSDFIIKLLKLPISFFDTRMTGDILQRIGDHNRIEQFLTGSSLNVLFSLFNLVIFSIVAATYNLRIFFVFLLSSLLYTFWVIIFLKFRRKMDNKRFSLSSQNQSNLIQLISGIHEIKMNNAEHYKRWEWENFQVKQFKWSIKNLTIGQYQIAGASLINEGKNILITFLSATAVINGQITLGGMLALQYIIGQLNSPIEQLIQFVHSWQDARISMERLNDIHEKEDEESPSKSLLDSIPSNSSIILENISFSYPGQVNHPVLKNISFTIPHNRITAIVGTSGSGKTTLLKLLLKYYSPQTGKIKLLSESKIGEGSDLNDISHRLWRSKCGTVLQDGFIFSDTIANNITVSDETPDISRLSNAISTANLLEFVEDLPTKYNTKIGAEGNGISQGQIQRLLIARAVYKDPDFIFFDEATNSLDANNEKTIMKNLEAVFAKKTVIVVAHRLSTVKNADQIIVLEKGEIVEIGDHKTLSDKKGKYYELVKNQLEIIP